MRKGTNPAKLGGNVKDKEDAFHQIVVPVHLPQLEGYYKEGFEILKLCLESIYRTVHRKTYISVINNGSCAKVATYLDECLNNKKIHEVIHTSPIGKINAIAKGLSGHDFDLVTITDADVLFTNGWQKAVYDILKAFPKAGMVGTTPNSKMLKHFTEPVHFDNLLNKNFRFKNTLEPDKMLEFGKSIGKSFIFNKVHLRKILTLTKNNTIAVVGTGHFTGTYRFELLTKQKQFYTEDLISAQSDKIYLDEPSVNYGHWRLCTYKNYTYHLGNTVEEWMEEKLDKLKTPTIEDYKTPILKCKGNTYFSKLKRILIRKCFFNKYVIQLYYRYLGLSKDEARLYIKHGEKE